MSKVVIIIIYPSHSGLFSIIDSNKKINIEVMSADARVVWDSP